MAVSLVDASPYTYAAIGSFFVSACSSDLLVIRLALMNAFCLLALVAWSNDSPDGSFSTDTMPFVDGSIDLPLILYTILFVWNFGASMRLLDDIIRPRLRKPLSPEDQALYHFFQRRCGLTRVEFDEIRSYGQFLELGSNTEVPFTDSTLYLILEGLVECETIERNNPRKVATMFPKRSGQFFDLKFFNVFSLPVGFDSLRFRATTATKTKLFGWSVRALASMRDSKSPSLRPFWEFIILRSLARDSVRHHLQALDASDNAWPLPEAQEWWDGKPSCDFEKPDCLPSDTRPSVFHILPPKGIRSRPPSMLLKRQPQQTCIEIVAKAKEDVDRMEGEEGSWQNVLFMSTFGCFKESSVDDSVSSPAKSAGRMGDEEQPTNSHPSLETISVVSHSASLSQHSSTREYDGNHYTNVRRHEEQNSTTPLVSNQSTIASSVRMRQQKASTETVPTALGMDGQLIHSYDVSMQGHPIRPGDQYNMAMEHQSTKGESSSTVKSELEEAKAEIQQTEPAPVFEAVWKEASMS